MEYEYPVFCPLCGRFVDEGICFDIHMVVCGEAPMYTMPKEVLEHKDFKDICERCKYHRTD